MHLLISLNFQLSVWLSIAGGIVLINQAELFFADASGLYGPLQNNLLVVAAYLCLMQLAAWWARFTRRFRLRLETLLMGFMYLGVAGGLQIYAQANQLPIQDWLSEVCLYVAFSHLLYFWSDSLQTRNGRAEVR